MSGLGVPSRVGQQPDEQGGRRQDGDRLGELAGAALVVADAGLGVLPDRVHDVVVGDVGRWAPVAMSQP